MLASLIDNLASEHNGSFFGGALTIVGNQNDRSERRPINKEPMATLKKCSRCQALLSLSDFRPRRGQCKKCCSELQSVLRGSIKREVITELIKRIECLENSMLILSKKGANNEIHSEIQREGLRDSLSEWRGHWA